MELHVATIAIRTQTFLLQRSYNEGSLPVQVIPSASSECPTSQRHVGYPPTTTQECAQLLLSQGVMCTIEGGGGTTLSI